jgi:hypothetical protein
MSTPLKASLMVLVWTSVMVVSFICLVMVLIKLGWTRPRVARSWNWVTGPSSRMLCSASASAAAICCHFALWWKPAHDAFARRAVWCGILRGAEDCAMDVRSALEETPDRLLERVVVHLRSANMVKGLRNDNSQEKERDRAISRYG